MKVFAVCLGSLFLVGSVFGAKVRPADVGSNTGPTKKASRRRRTSSAEAQRRQLSQMKDSDILTPQNPENVGDNIFQRTYQAVTYGGDSNFYGGVIVDEERTNSIGKPYAAKEGANGINLLGTATTSMSSIFKQDTVQLQDLIGGKYMEIEHRNGGRYQPVRHTMIPPHPEFFMQNTCKVTKSGQNGNTEDNIDQFKWTTLAHSCWYDICLGGGGMNCINVYSGSPFLFAQPVVGGPPSNTPPAFSGFIAGGTGAFYRINGYAQFTIEAGPLPFGQENTVRGIPATGRGTTVHTVTLFTNQELPPGPGADTIIV